MLLNASPDIREQIGAAPGLRPFGTPANGIAPRDSPIDAIVLTNADVDHVAGLLTLRERWPFRLYASAAVHAALDANPVFAVLAEDVVERIETVPGQPFEPVAGVVLTLFSVPGKVPLWDEGAVAQLETAVDDGRTVGVMVGRPERPDAFYIPGCAMLTPALAARLDGANLVLFDGTLFEDDEMIRAGLGSKTARRMGHMPVAGPGGSLEAFAALDIRRKIFVHINNSNPMLIEDAPERQAVAERGWDVAEDGMEIAL